MLVYYSPQPYIVLTKVIEPFFELCAVTRERKNWKFEAKRDKDIDI